MTADTMVPNPVVRLERLLPAPLAEVFRAWTDPAVLGDWMSPAGHAEVELDLRVGGGLRVVMIDAAQRIEHTGTFLEFEPPRRLRFTWISPYTGSAPSVVTVELAPEGDQTRLVLTHERLPRPVVAAHAGGWGTMVDRLAGALAAGAAKEAMP